MSHMNFKSGFGHGFSVQFSPYYPNQLAYVTSENFGLHGGGALYILGVLPDGTIQPVALMKWADCLFDVCWSRVNQDVCVTAGGDGSVQVWSASDMVKPVKVIKEHTKEVYSIEWSQVPTDDRFATASWDETVKVWNLDCPTSLCTFSAHEGIVYDLSWSPFIPGCIASVSGDKCLKVWNTRSPDVGYATIKHDTEVLSCDWNRLDQNIIATGSVDGVGRVWDLRFPQLPIAELMGHQFGLRRIKFSPHRKTILASASYDLTTRIWDYQQSAYEIEAINSHSEFVYGLDFNFHTEGELADCSLDQNVCIYSPLCLQPQP